MLDVYLTTFTVSQLNKSGFPFESNLQEFKQKGVNILFVLISGINSIGIKPLLSTGA